MQTGLNVVNRSRELGGLCSALPSGLVSELVAVGAEYITEP